MTSYNPLPAHITAMQENTAVHTPTYGGQVETGAEWDFVLDRNGRRRFVHPPRSCTDISRTPSRSPHRAATDSNLHRMDPGSSYQTSPPPTYAPQEPTINEESAAAVNNRLRAQNGNGSASKKRTGRMVGDWQLQKTLGAGSMGKVKLATNAITKEKVS